jgi:hypothetical protein
VTSVTGRGTENPLLQCQTECETVQAARKPNFVLDDHSSRRRLAATLKQPTRRFRPLASLRKPALHDPGRDGPSRAGRIRGGGQTPCLFGLAPCGVYRAIGVTTNAVGSYPAVSPLPQIAYMGVFACAKAQQPEAVYFLLHWPSTRLATRIPDVIRHTALRSSDFPPPPDSELREAAIVRPPAHSDSTGGWGVVQGFWNRWRGLGVDVVTGRGGRRAICVQLPVGQMPDSSWRTGNGKVLTRRSRRKDAKVAKERREGREGRAGDALVEMTDVLRLVGRSRVGLRQVSNGEKRGIAGGAAVAVGE